jgi:hypothetical protein
VEGVGPPSAGSVGRPSLPDISRALVREPIADTLPRAGRHGQAALVAGRGGRYALLGDLQPAARARHAELVPIAATSESPLLKVGLTVAAPLLATDDSELAAALASQPRDM